MESGGRIEGYELTRSIGKGNYGQVFATTRPDGKVVAVKKMAKVRACSVGDAGRWGRRAVGAQGGGGAGWWVVGRRPRAHLALPSPCDPAFTTHPPTHPPHSLSL